MTRVWGSLPLFGGPDGGTEGAWQRRDVFLLLRDAGACPACEALEEALRRGTRRPQDEGVQVVRLLRGAAPQDEGGRRSSAVDREVGQQGAYLVVADRFARAYAALPVHGQAPEVVLAEAWSWMDYLRSQCEECGAPLEW